MKKLIFHGLLALASLRLSAQHHTQSKNAGAHNAILQMIEQAVEAGKKDTLTAQQIFLQAIDKATALNDHYLTGKAYYEMGEMYHHHKNPNHSFGAYFNAREQFVKANAGKELAYTSFALGRQQYLRGNYKIGAGHLNYAMREARLLKLPELESNALEYLGLLYHVMPGGSRLSIAHFKKSYLIKQKLKDQKGMMRMLQKLGDAYYAEKYYDSALTCFQQSIDMAILLNHRHDADISRLDKAGALIRLNKLKEAGYELRYIAFEADTSDFNIRIRYYIQRGNYFTAQKQFAEGIRHYNTALAIGNGIGVVEIYGLVYKNMADAYYAQGMYKEAYTYSQLFNTHIADFYDRNMTISKDLEYIFNTSLTKDEITYLNGENSYKARLLQNERSLRAVLLAGTAALLLLAAIIFYLYRKQKNKNTIIKKQSDDLHTLMQEIHHRVKNNLQIISSLLDLQSVHITDNQAALAIKESRNRVHSMALIHQYLYGEENIQGIAVDEYIANLAKNLFYSYNILPEQVTLKTEIEKLNLDIDTVIPVGLVLNELISNSLKHAFVDSSTGTINVTIKKDEGILFLQVKDNGQGFPEAAVPPGSFGMRLINIFAHKLKADLELCNDQGACVTMRIRKFKLGA